MYRGSVYDVDYFYTTFINHFWKAISSKDNKEKLKLHDIPLYDGAVIIYGVPDVNKFIDFILEYFIRFIYNLRGKEQSFVWDMYIMCYPQNVHKNLFKNFKNNFVFYDYRVLNPYVRFYVPKNDEERIDIILKNVIAGVLSYVVGVSNNEFGKKNIICER